MANLLRLASARLSDIFRSLSGRPSLGDPFILASRWRSVDGDRAHGLGVTTDRKTLAVIHPGWWAARPASKADIETYRQIPMPDIDGLITSTRDAINMPLSKSWPRVILMSVAGLREWSDPCRVFMCPVCDDFCEKHAERRPDAIRQHAYRNVAKLPPWSSRFHKDAISALLDTAPVGMTECWVIRSHLYQPGGGAFITFASPDFEWIAQSRSSINTLCQAPHDPTLDTCVHCDRSDAEFWREPGDGLS